MQDYDTALVHYERALRADPTNAEYKLRATKMRIEDGQFHIEQGRKAAAKGRPAAGADGIRKGAGDRSFQLDCGPGNKDRRWSRSRRRTPPTRPSRSIRIRRTTRCSRRPRAEAAFARTHQSEDDERRARGVRDDRQARGAERDFRSGFHVAADHGRTAERDAGAGAGCGVAGKQSVLEADDAQRDFRGAGQSAEAERRGRRRGEDVLSFQYADAAGFDGNRHRASAAARFAARPAGELAERDRDPRHAGQAGAGGEDYSRHRQGQAGSADPRAGAVGEPGPAARPGNFAGAERIAGVHSAHFAAAEQHGSTTSSTSTTRRPTTTTTTTARLPQITLEQLEESFDGGLQHHAAGRDGERHPDRQQDARSFRTRKCASPTGKRRR